MALDRCPPGPIAIVSICAGDGRDLLGALRDHPRRLDVRARLVKLDPELVGRGRARAAELGLDGVELRVGDAAETTAYAAAVPVDVVLAWGGLRQRHRRGRRGDRPPPPWALRSGGHGDLDAGAVRARPDPGDPRLVRRGRVRRARLPHDPRVHRIGRGQPARDPATAVPSRGAPLHLPGERGAALEPCPTDGLRRHPGPMPDPQCAETRAGKPARARTEVGYQVRRQGSRGARCRLTRCRIAGERPAAPRLSLGEGSRAVPEGWRRLPVTPRVTPAGEAHTSAGIAARIRPSSAAGVARSASTVRSATWA